MIKSMHLFVTGMFGLFAIAALPAHAGDVIADWSQGKMPPAPALKEVSVDPKTTALLVLDFMRSNCNNERRPRCVESLPKAKALLERARTAGMPVVYAIVANSTTKDVWPEVAPLESEPWVQAGPDKFRNTQLQKFLADKGVKSVIVTGTAAQGAVLYTGSAAALSGMDVIVPIDLMSAETIFHEQYVAFHFATAPGVSQRTTLTRSDMMKF
jgi:nicotinamidase-related amidase